MAQVIKDRGRIVTMAGTGINLALGVLYTWSIFKVAIKQSIESGAPGAFAWDLATLNDPYAVACLVFALGMIIAGKCQDAIGPRITATIGGVLVGAGFIWISQTTSYTSWILGFGILVGLGIAFGYSSATPAALKWYPPTKTGKIAGIVVAGFGLASVYIAPLSKYLLDNIGLSATMLFFGVAFLVAMTLLSTLLVNPPEGFIPAGFVCRRANREARVAFVEKDFSASEMMRTRNFWLLWTLYFIGAGAGLMVIGSIAGMAKSSLGENAFIAVAILAIGNAGGRIVAGILSDKIGRTRTLAAVFILQAVFMFLTVPVIGAETTSAALLVLLATLIGFNYGANLALFPSFAKDFYGIKHFGVNYGILFTAWGVGGFIMSKASQTLMAGTGSFAASFMTSGVLLVIGAGMTFAIRDEKEIARREIAKNAPEDQLAAA